VRLERKEKWKTSTGELVMGDHPMQDLQARQSNRGQSETFPKGNSTNHRTGRTDLWPARSGDGPYPLFRIGRRALSNRSEVNRQSPDFGYYVQRRSVLQQFLASFSLERAFTLFGFTVVAILISVFGLDLVCGWPFRRASILFDSTSTICGAMLLFLCWGVFTEQAKGLTR
jgi:hypothetical protein